MTHDETDRTAEEPHISTPLPPARTEADESPVRADTVAAESTPAVPGVPANGAIGQEPESASIDTSPPAPRAADEPEERPEPAPNGSAAPPGVAAEDGQPATAAQSGAAEEPPVPDAVSSRQDDSAVALEVEAIVQRESPPARPEVEVEVEVEVEAAAPVEGDVAARLETSAAGETSTPAVELPGALPSEPTDATAPAQVDETAPSQTDGSAASQDGTVTGTPRTPRPRRKRRSAAERHRGAFFAKLGELRRAANAPTPPTATVAGPSTDSVSLAPTPEGVQPPANEAAPAPNVEASASVAEPAADLSPVVADGAPVGEPAVDLSPVVADGAPVAEPPPDPSPAVEADGSPAPEAEPAQAAATTERAAEEIAGAPAVEEPVAEERAAEDDQPPTPARVQARLAAAIERVGGVEVVQEALQPKRNEKGEPLKWAAVCCDAAEGKAPGDPVFLAWVRLASTPVREIKAQIRPPREDRGGGGRGPRRGSQSGGERGGKAGGDRAGGRSGGGGGRGQGDRRPRSGGGRDRDRSIEDAAKDLLRDGSFRPSVRIVGGDDDEKRERERLRKEKREAKRQAERERLARLGY